MTGGDDRAEVELGEAAERDLGLAAAQEAQGLHVQRQRERDVVQEDAVGEDERVEAVAAVDGEARLAEALARKDERVVARPAEDQVAAAAAGDGVVAGAALDRVHRSRAGHAQRRARGETPAEEDELADIGGENDVEPAREGLAGLRAQRQDGEARPGEADCLHAAHAREIRVGQLHGAVEDQPVIARVARDAAPWRQEVGLAVEDEGVVARPAGDHVGPAADVDAVIARSAQDGVVAAGAPEVERRARSKRACVKEKIGRGRVHPHDERGAEGERRLGAEGQGEGIRAEEAEELDAAHPREGGVVEGHAAAQQQPVEPVAAADHAPRRGELGRGDEDEVVVAARAEQLVGPAAAQEGVVARPAVERIGTRTTAKELT